MKRYIFNGKLIAAWALIALFISVTANYCSAGTIQYHLGSIAPSAPPGHDPVYWSNFIPLRHIEGAANLYIGATNYYYNDRLKDVTFYLTGTNLDKITILTITPYTTGGLYKKNDIWILSQKDIIEPIKAKPDKLEVNIWFNPQPDGEWLCLSIPSGVSIDVTEVKAPSTCYKRKNKGFTHTLEDAWEYDGSDLRLTEIWYFPVSVPVDTNITPTFTGPINSGNWTYQWVDTDPFGDLMKQGGVKWTTDGIGINELEAYSLSLSMTQLADTWYLQYAFDAVSGEYIYNYIDCVPLPSTLLLLGSGLLLFACHLKMRKI